MGEEEDDEDDSAHMLAIPSIALVKAVWGTHVPPKKECESTTDGILRGVRLLAATVAVECDLRRRTG